MSLRPLQGGFKKKWGGPDSGRQSEVKHFLRSDVSRVTVIFWNVLIL